jgi:uncharacterized protein with beta-barrel porin domain
MAADTFNQTQAAEALDNLDRTDADADEVYMALLFATTGEALTAFDTASGEIYAAQLAAGTRRATRHANGLLARSRAFIGEGLGVWGGPSLASSSLDSDGNAAFSRSEGFGADLGVDYRGPGDGWALGASLGYVESDLDVAGRTSISEAEGYRLGAYARYGDNAAGLTISAALTFADLDVEASRTIAINTLSRTATSAFSEQSFGVTAEVRYGLSAGKGAAFGPVISLLHASAEIDGFSEASAGAVNLSSDGGDFGRTRAGVGAFGKIATERVRFDGSVQYVDGSSAVAGLDLLMQGAPATPFTVRSAEDDGGGVLAALVAEIDLAKNVTLAGDFRALMQGELEDYAGSIVIGWRF